MPANNIEILNAELNWLSQLIDKVILSYLNQDGHEAHWADIELPSLQGKSGVYAS